MHIESWSTMQTSHFFAKKSKWSTRKSCRKCAKRIWERRNRGRTGSTHVSLSECLGNELVQNQDCMRLRTIPGLLEAVRGIMVRHEKLNVSPTFLDAKSCLHHQCLCTTCSIESYGESIRARTIEKVARHTLGHIGSGVRWLTTHQCPGLGV